jgi:hypothetical protein
MNPVAAYDLAVRFMPVLKAFLLAAAGFGLARALFVHDGVGVLEWLVGVAMVGALSVRAAHFARQSFRTR